MHPHYQLGIDLGTTWTAASICRAGEARAESVALGTAAAAVASVVFLAPDGTMLTGEPAQRRALVEPARVVREFKRRIGDGTPLVVGGQPVPAEVLSARFVGRVVAEVAHREGGPAQAVAVTHPVEWGVHKRRSFAAALAAEGLPDVLFLTEPQAAAVGYASAERVEPGRTIAVYDLGGGTFDAAVVRKADDGTFALLGRPTGLERLGGVDFDDAVFAHVREAVGAAWDALDPDDPAVRTAVAGLRRECTAAKETLSADVEVMIPVLLPGLHTTVRLGRAEFEDMIRPSVAETVEALRRAVAAAGVEPRDLDAVLLVGGSSRIPLVAQMVSADLGRPVAVDVDPKAVVAAGAALAARRLVTPLPMAPTSYAGPDDGTEAPTGPIPVVTDAPSAGPQRRRGPRTGAVAAAAVAVAVALGVSVSVATDVGPAASSSPAPAPEAGIATPPVDPWTGDVLAASAPDPGAEAGTPEALTTTAGPRRATAVAARVRPVARNVPTGAVGAVGAAPAVRGAAAAPAAVGVAPPRNAHPVQGTNPGVRTGPAQGVEREKGPGTRPPASAGQPPSGGETSGGGGQTPVGGAGETPVGGGETPVGGGGETPVGGGGETPVGGGETPVGGGGETPVGGGETPVGGGETPVGGGGETPVGGGETPVGGETPSGGEPSA